MSIFFIDYFFYKNYNLIVNVGVLGVNMKEKIKIIIFIITIIIIAISMLIIGIEILNKDRNIYSNINVQRVTDYEIVQGDVAIYEIKEQSLLDSDSQIKVEIVNMRGISVEDAKVDGNKILIDTSMLATGRFRIKIIQDEKVYLLEDVFRVILVVC